MTEQEERRRDLGDGRAIWLRPQIFTWLLCIGAVDDPGYSNMWEYQDKPAALLAFAEWEPATEPEPRGWYRHPPTGRRRPDGDPAREYVHL